jgi:hypothetical protein
MSNSIGDIITVPDSVKPDTEVPAIVTAVAEDGSTVNVTVFGNSDVVEKRVVSTEVDEPEPVIEEPVATGSRRASATTAEGEK